MSKKIKKLMNKPSLMKEWNDTSFNDLPKRWSGAYGKDNGLTEFEEQGGKDVVSEGSMKIGQGKFANLYKIKEDMKEGKFDPKNPQVHILGLGVYTLKLMEKVIKRDLTKAANDLGGELGAKNLNIHLYGKHIPLGSKIKGLYEVYQQMNSPQYKRAITMYKRKR